MAEWLNLSVPGFWVAVVLGLVAGLGAGVAAAWWFHRRGGAAKSAARVKAELDDYRGEVNAHFDKTSDLFRDLTERYRDLYEHLASGANALCADESSGKRLETSVRELLTAGIASGSGDTNIDSDATDTSGRVATAKRAEPAAREFEPVIRGVDSPRPLPEAAADAPLETRKRSA